MERGRSGPVCVISPYICGNESTNPNKFRGNIGQTWMWSVVPYYPKISITHLVLLLLPSVKYKIFCPTYLLSLMIWVWWGTSIFILIPHHPMLDSYLVFWSLSISTNTLTFLPTFTVIVSTFMLCSLGCNVLSVSASDLISDHYFDVANLQSPSSHNRTIPQTIKYRKLQSINMEAFKADIQNSDLIRYPKTNANELAEQYDQYDSALHTLINLHAQCFPRKISLKPPNSWMTPAILASRRHCRYLERVWRRNPTALNRCRLSRQTHLCN